MYLIYYLNYHYIINETIYLYYRGQTSFAIAINLMYGMASLSSTFALLLVTESAIKSKHVQKVSGVYLSNFWFSALLWDLINFLLPCLLILVSIAVLQIHFTRLQLRYTLMFLLFGLRLYSSVLKSRHLQCTTIPWTCC